MKEKCLSSLVTFSEGASLHRRWSNYQVRLADGVPTNCILANGPFITRWNFYNMR